MTEDDEIDEIYSGVLGLLERGDTAAVGDILDHVDMDMPTVILLAYASITTVAAGELGDHRRRYMGRVRRRLTETDPARVDELLLGLE